MSTIILLHLTASRSKVWINTIVHNIMKSSYLDSIMVPATRALTRSDTLGLNITSAIRLYLIIIHAGKHDIVSDLIGY